jgi:hypothetical protein
MYILREMEERTRSSWNLGFLARWAQAELGAAAPVAETADQGFVGDVQCTKEGLVSADLRYYTLSASEHSAEPNAG